MKTIQEFSDEDLVEELMARYDDIVIGARRVLTTGESPKANRRRWWKGDMDACVGLCSAVCNDLTIKTWGISPDDIKQSD